MLRAPADRVFGMETVGRHHDPFTVMAQLDGPVSLRTHLQPLTDVPGALAARASNPIAAYNWLVLVTFPLSAASAYLLGRHLQLTPAPAAIAAVAFAFSPFHLAQAAYHPHVAQTQWIPLYFLALWRCLDRATLRASLFLAVAASGVTLSNFYGGLIAAVVTPAAALAYWSFGSRGTRRRRHLAITALVLLVIAGGAVTGAWFAGHPAVANGAAYAVPRADLFRYSVSWWSYLVPPLAHPLLGGFAREVWTSAGVTDGRLEQQVSLGWGFAGLALVALFAWRQAPSRMAFAAVPALAVVAVVALVCSLSPERNIGPFTFTRPSALLYGLLPMFRSYARFGVVVQLMTVLLAAFGLQFLWNARTMRARAACALLLALAVTEYAVWPPALWRDVLPTSAHRWAMQQPAGLRVLDCAPLTVESESVQWLTGQRVAMRPEGTECIGPQSAGALAAAGYSHVLVRQGGPESRWIRVRGVPAGLQSAAHFRDSAVLRITTPADRVYTVLMTGFHPREYDGQRTWRWMGREASWDIVNDGSGTIVAAVDIELEAFREARELRLLLNGRDVQTLVVEESRRRHRIGPLVLTPGRHRLLFHAAEPPTVPADHPGSQDRRPLSVMFGASEWIVTGGS